MRVLIGLLVCLIASSAAQATIPSWERDALIALYVSTEGWNWMYNSGWLGPVGTECTWHGITCGPGELAVIGIDLSSIPGGNNLVGTLPPQIGNFASLETLDLSGNVGLSGDIPPALWGLSSLEFLNLARNRLRGTLPENIGGMTSLQELEITDNLISGHIPSVLGGLPALQMLRLGDNSLSGQIPPELGGLVNLVSLDLAENDLNGEIPVEIGNLTQACGSIRLYLNALHATNPVLVTFLDNCAEWTPQVSPPQNVTILNGNGRFATVGWDPVIGLPEGGNYEILISGSPSGPFERVPSTATLFDLHANYAVAGPLEPLTDYYLAVRTVLYPVVNGSWNWNDKNTVVSWLSPPLLVSTGPAGELFVATTGDDLNNCLSPQTSCRTIQAAIAKASPGDALEIAPGTYMENILINKDLLLRGSPLSLAVIDGQALGSAVFVGSGLSVGIQNVQVTGGQASSGGGILNNGAVLLLENTEVAGNVALFEGGGLFNDGGAVVVESSTFADNLAGSDSAVGSNTGRTAFRNSTVSNNASLDAFSSVLTLTTLANSTVAENSAGDFGYIATVVWSHHAIIADNLSPNCAQKFWASYGHNIEDSDSCLWEWTDYPEPPHNGDLVNVDPLLSPLQANGGPTRTHALDTSSPAIDAGENDAAPLVDQRGGVRPVDGDDDGTAVCDIGSFEYGAVPALFADGFESGDTSAWSATVP